MSRTPHSNSSDYYASLKFNPVGHDISRKGRLLLHERKRRSLLENRLKLPLRLWRGRRVLEFGPASGENAVVIARHGARLTFVEPLDYLFAELKANFASYGLLSSIEGSHQEVLEHFKTDERFDFVIAEGFVNFLDDAAGATRKLISFLEPGGVVIVSTLDRPGMFIELVTKAYLGMAAAKLGVSDFRERFELARSVLEAKFGAINHSRGFEAYAKDMPLNPLVRPRYFFSLPEALPRLPHDIALYASYPNYLSADDLVWHKNIKTAAEVSAEALRGYYARAPHFIHGKPCRPGELELFDPEAGRRVLKSLDSSYAKLERCLLRGEDKPQAYAQALGDLRRELARHKEARQSLAVVDDAIGLFKSSQRASDRRAFVRAFHSRPLLRTLWGMPGHYFVLQRTA